MFIAILEKLASAKFRLGVISNTGSVALPTIRKALDAANLLVFFDKDLIVFSGEVGLDKSKPAIFQLAAQRTGATAAPGSCLYVGDDPDERRTARTAGLRTATSILRLNKGLPASLTDVPHLSNLAACVEDARIAALDSSPGPAEPNNYHQLLGRLEAAKSKLPPAYRVGFPDPLLGVLRDLGEQQFNQLLASDPQRERGAGLLLDMSHAVLQNGEGFEPVATDSFEELVSDLYDGFLSAEDRGESASRITRCSLRWANGAIPILARTHGPLMRHLHSTPPRVS